MALSIPGLLRDRVARTPHAEAMRYRDHGGWASLTWAQLQGRVAIEAFGLHAKGLRKGDRVALMGGTSIEWIVTDLAVLAAGGATTTIYPNSTRGEVAHIVKDSGSRMVVVETDEPYVEETWLGRELGAGSAVLRGGASIPRCTVIDHSPATGEKDARLLKALASYRPLNGAGEPAFGIYASVAAPGVVTPGATTASLL